eukprot:COSAG02_NODE_27474_length_608_cov_12.803536_1_plen_59_part_00
MVSVTTAMRSTLSIHGILRRLGRCDLTEGTRLLSIRITEALWKKVKSDGTEGADTRLT